MGREKASFIEYINTANRNCCTTANRNCCVEYINTANRNCCIEYINTANRNYSPNESSPFHKTTLRSDLRMILFLGQIALQSCFVWGHIYSMFIVIFLLIFNPRTHSTPAQPVSRARKHCAHNLEKRQMRYLHYSKSCMIRAGTTCTV